MTTSNFTHLILFFYFVLRLHSYRSLPYTIRAKRSTNKQCRDGITCCRTRQKGTPKIFRYSNSHRCLHFRRKCGPFYPVTLNPRPPLFVSETTPESVRAAKLNSGLLCRSVYNEGRRTALITTTVLRRNTETNRRIKLPLRSCQPFTQSSTKSSAQELGEKQNNHTETKPEGKREG